MRSLDADLATDAPDQLSWGDGFGQTQHSPGPQILEQDQPTPLHIQLTGEGQAGLF